RSSDLDGSVVAWGYYVNGQTNVPSGLSNVVAIAAGGMHSLAVKNDGTIAAWGGDSFGQCEPPTGLSNVTAVAAGWTHSLALKSDGTVTAWGDNTFGESTVPSGLSNAIAIAAGGDPFAGEQSAYSMALQRDGTVVAWGSGPVLELPVGMDGVMALGAGVSHASAIRYGRLTPVIIHEPTNQYQISGGAATFTAVAVAPGALQYQWQDNGTNIS